MTDDGKEHAVEHYDNHSPTTTSTASATRRHNSRYLSDEELYALRSEWVQEAARVGRLRSPPEHVVESVGLATEEKQDTWRLKSSAVEAGLTTSHYVQVMNDAAAMGRARLLRTNSPSSVLSDELNEEATVETKENSMSLRTPRPLPRTFFQAQKRSHSWSAGDIAFLQDAPSTMEKLPTVPRRQYPSVLEEESNSPRGSFLYEIVEKAQEHEQRVQKSSTRLTQVCTCKYCITASPSQTDESKVIPVPPWCQEQVVSLKGMASNAAATMESGRNMLMRNLLTRQRLFKFPSMKSFVDG
mmetsp:Transcript_23101/g.37532  ORF Transcript_23101/g.37532 Transcript_23101/m.37532 type:complete len:299 (+) Transcript_23101:425-1321(+)